MKKVLILSLLAGMLFAPGLIHANNTAQGFVHPGMLHTQADFDRVKAKLAAKVSTYVEGYAKLTANSHAQLTYTPSATKWIVRGASVDGVGENYSRAMNDAAAAYQCGLRWKLSGDKRYADKAVSILNQWANTCVLVTGNSNLSLAAGIYGYEFANAAELVRDYEGWDREDFARFQKFMLNVFYTANKDFLRRRHGTCNTHYWSNWGLCNILSAVSIGILCDDVYIYNEAMDYFKENNYAEQIKNLVWYMHEDARGPLGYLGQMQEANRDQGHCTLSVGFASDICEIAWNQGDDVYSEFANRLAAGFEFVACYNSGEDVPDNAYTTCEGETQTVVSASGRGNVRPIWTKVLNHFENRKGITMKYSRKMMEACGIEGGGGDYGPNSGGFDALGFGTLMNSLDSLERDKIPVTLEARYIYKNKTYDLAERIGVSVGDSLILCPQLPLDEVDTGEWLWDDGTKAQVRVVFPEKSTVYRVVYVNSKGVKTAQAYFIAVKGDCVMTDIKPVITTKDETTYTGKIRVTPGTSVTLSTSERYGTFRWSNNKILTSMTFASLLKDTTMSVLYTNTGGARTTLTYDIKVSDVVPYVKSGTGERKKGNSAVVSTTGHVELIAHSNNGKGSWKWSSGETDSSIVLSGLSEPVTRIVTYTNEANQTFVDTFTVKVYKVNTTFANGDYFIQNVLNGTYLTNDGNSSVLFRSLHTENLTAQGWTITKDGSRYKIVSKKNGAYLNENGVFGTNSYLAVWNTYTLYNAIGSDEYAIQNGGSSGTYFWGISNDVVIIGKNESTLTGFPFRLLPYNTNVNELQQEVSEKPILLQNPVTELISFEISTPAKFVLTTLSGQQIGEWELGEGIQSIPSSNLPTGMYIGLLQMNGNTYSYLLLKK